MPTGTNIKGKTPIKKSAIKKAATVDNKRQAPTAEQERTVGTAGKAAASADGIQRGSVPQEPAPKQAKVEQTQRGDETPEAKRTTKEQQRAAEKLFANADDAAHRGYPPDITREQHENIVRRAALGY